ncbi:MAG: RNA polymerase subunit sigma [Bdellovibrio sp. 28-41-41]|nr:MAG: RNA polymerase subunit sigma [Bdellovibrio sp. 28-41-41]
MGKDLLILTDNELVQEIKTGNRKAFSEIVKRHQKSLLRMSLRFVKDLDMAEDVVQESFIKAFEKLNAFEGRSSFKSWLFQIAVNTAKNKLRERRRTTTDIDSVQLAVGAVAESSLVHSALSQEIQEEIDKLPTKQRTALILRVYEDLSFKEIADIMECPYDTAKANYRHALMKLKDSFEQKSDMSVADSFGGFYSEVAQYVEVE